MIFGVRMLIFCFSQEYRLQADVKKSNGLVVIRLPAEVERSFSIALSAQISGRALKVSLDDNRVDSRGYCIPRWLNIANE